MKKNRLKLGLVATALISFILGASFVYLVYAPTASTFWITEGIYPSSYSYTIWRESSTYYSKNAYGQIEFEGTNLTTVSQNSIDAVASGSQQGTVFYKEGEFRAPASIKLKDGVDIKGSGMLATRFDNDNPIPAYESAVFSWVGGTIYRGFKISDLSITGYGTDAPCINIEGGGAISDIELSRLWLHNAGDSANTSIYSDGLHMNNVYSSSINDCLFENNEQYGADINSCNAINFFGSRFLSNNVGLRIISNVQTTVRDTVIENNANVGLYIWDSIGTKVDHSYFENNVNEHIRMRASAYMPCDDNVISHSYFTGMPIAIRMFTGGTYYLSRPEIWHNFFNAQTDKSISIEDANVTNAFIYKNYFAGVASELSDSGTGTRFIEDDASGVATISASTSVVVTHGLTDTPTIVIVTLGTTGAGDYYAEDFQPTEFTINVVNSGTYTVYWYAEVNSYT